MVTALQSFGSDQMKLEKWAKDIYSDKVGEGFERVEAIRLFREEKVDILIPDNKGGWNAFLLKKEIQAVRMEVRETTARHHKRLLDGSIA